MNNYFKAQYLKKIIADNWFLLAFSAVYYGIIVFLAGYLNIWEDELYSLNTSSKSLSYAFHQSEFFELQPPVYFLLLTLWRWISDSILWARMLNMFLIVLSQVLLYNFLVKVTDKKKITAFSILFLLNPTVVYTLLEIRLPALLIFLSLVISSLFYNTYYSGNISNGRRALVIIFSVAGLFTQYYFGFLLFANALVLLITGRKKALWSYLLDMILPLFLILFYLHEITRSADMVYAASPAYARTFLDFINEIKILASQITFSYFFPSDYIISAAGRWILRIIFICLIVYSVFHTDTRTKFRSFLPFILIPVILFLFFIIVDYYFGEFSVLLPKYTLVVFIPVFILVIYMVRQARVRLFNAVFILLTLIYLVQDIERYSPLYKHDDFKTLGNYLQLDEKKGEDIFVYRNINGENLKIYYKGINKILPIVEPFSFNEEYSTRLWKLTSQDIQKLSDDFKQYNSFYVIIFDNQLPEFKEINSNIMSLLTSKYDIKKYKYFNEGIYLYKISAKI